MSLRAPPLQTPRSIRLVGHPLLRIFARAVAGAVRQAVFLFPAAVLVALPLAVAIVSFGLAAATIVAIVAHATVVSSRGSKAADRVAAHLTEAHGRHGRPGAGRAAAST